MEISDRQNRTHGNDTNDSTAVSSKGITKIGKPRKRNKYETALETRKLIRLMIRSVKPACKDTCKRTCKTHFTEEQRTEINNKFWNLSYECQGLYIKSLVREMDVQKRLMSSQALRNQDLHLFS